MTLVNTPAEELVMGMNAVYNDTATREMQFVVNARDGSNSLAITGHRCIYNCVIYVAPVYDKPLEKETNLWSDPKTWKNLPNRIPLEGEDVVIESGRNVIYDIGRSPLFKSLEING